MHLRSLGSGAPVRERWLGQSIVEFSLVLPLLLILFIAIADLSRVYTTMTAVESAAREAADFGAFNSSQWIGDPLDPTSNYSLTLAAMKERACTAASDLPDFAGSDTDCTNPNFTFELVRPNPSVDCTDSTNPTPCRVKVTLTHDFHVIVPLGFEFFGVHIGFPDTYTFSRTSIFAISDFALDKP